MYDVIVIGGGPAGLSAALVLGRSVRSVLVCEGGDHRNDASRAVHGFLSRDGTPPSFSLSSSQRFAAVEHFGGPAFARRGP
ncbi:FAD-dependent oxidoreductase [Nannocystis bainbridge]|uniref:FAD-dependent oxidoreductase n=1 Tax=Nannocystis bainbridge TaxID=2995303 RepID=A0ABT5ECE7_9BACT|nr:FAD-dependent oxidoreductase [Nannocystis bainbridge]MDC0723547.1 FAD-dependent oxidoreductase [Nannocystis bainbridge]